MKIHLGALQLKTLILQLFLFIWLDLLHVYCKSHLQIMVNLLQSRLCRQLS